MLQIIHLSDFHMNSKNRNDWNSYVKDAFIDKIKQLELDYENLLFVCTGDLIDKGGSDNTTIQEAFELFKVEVVELICKEFSITLDRFLIIPGNHDVDRNADSLKIEIGNRNFYKTYNNILSEQNKMLDKGEREGVKRIIPFAEFEKSLYEKVERYSSFLGSAFKYDNINGFKVGVACLNTAWRAYDDNDKEHLILGEEQLNRCSKYIKNCDIKIALMHHPIDWLRLENNIISGHLSRVC